MADPFNPQRPFPQPDRSFGTEQPSDAGPVSAGYQQIDLRRGLAAYYPFFPVATTSDLVGQNGTSLVGSATQTTGPGQLSALDLTGTDGYLTTDSVGISSHLTLSAWVRTTDQTGGRYIVAHDDGTDGKYALYLPASNPSAVAFEVTSGTNTTTLVADETGIDVADGEWHHICATYSGAIGRVYVDGVADPSVLTADLLDASTAPVTVGARGDGTGSFEGALSDVRLYSRSLSTPSVRRLSGVSAPLAGVKTTDVRDDLLWEYHFDGDATETYGGPTGQNDGGVYVDGHRQQAIQFDASADTSMVLGSGPFPDGHTPRSVSLWVRMEELTANQWICTIQYMGFIQLGNGSIRYRGNVDGTLKQFPIISNPTTGEWYHIVATYDGTRVRGYGNGEYAGSITHGDGSWWYAATYDSALSGGSGGNPASATVDELRFYGRQLSDTDAAALYRYGRPRFARPAVMTE